MAVVRARCCERLGTTAIDGDSGGEFFLLGLCSLLDVLLDRPMDAVLKQLSLPPRTLEALAGTPGRTRTLLDAVIAYERGDWGTAAAAGAAVGLDLADLSAAYKDAVAWAHGMDTRGSATGGSR